MELNEASVGDILQELERRLPAFVISYHLPDDGDTVQTRCARHGNRASVLGLAHVGVHDAEAALGLRECFKTIQPLDTPGPMEPAPRPAHVPSRIWNLMTLAERRVLLELDEPEESPGSDDPPSAGLR